MAVILYKNDRSFFRYASGRECTFDAFPVMRRRQTSRSFAGASDVETLSIASSSFDLNTSGLLSAGCICHVRRLYDRRAAARDIKLRKLLRKKMFSTQDCPVRARWFWAERTNGNYPDYDS